MKVVKQRRRRFNLRERNALYWATDGHCASCGEELSSYWHADHKEPWAAGGITDVINGQALCPSCNIKKGDAMPQELPPLYIWQQDGIEKYLNHSSPDFLAEITPAAGKTRFAAEIASRLIDGDLVERIIMVVPTTPLRKQSSNGFLKWAGLQLNYKWISGSFPVVEFEGIVVTYQSVITKQFDYRKFCADRPTLVILDEPHHTAAEQPWGLGLQNAFEPATRRLLLTGTPFRSDEAKIPFVVYGDGGIAHGDIRYSYGQALKDGIVRWVGFPDLGGKLEWIETDGKKTATFDDDLDEEGQSRRLRTALSVKPGFELMPRLLANAHRELLIMRQDDSRAAGIVFAMHQDHAREIMDHMQKNMHIDPVLAISDEPASNDDIEKFKESDALWIITVRKVSEGIDITRLRVGVYATNVVTEMFFRQAVGRIIRCGGAEALFFIPTDPRLIQFALDIKKLRDAVFLAALDDKRKREIGERQSLFIPLASNVGNNGAIADQFRLSQSEIEHAERVKLVDSNTARLPTLTVAVLLRNAGHIHQPPIQPTDMVKDKTAVIHELKQKNSKVARALALKYGIDYSFVNNALNQLCDIKSITQCFVIAILERRLTIAQQWYVTGEVPVHA
jgi:superfamily II DNA or RNA helicase